MESSDDFLRMRSLLAAALKGITITQGFMFHLLVERGLIDRETLIQALEAFAKENRDSEAESEMLLLATEEIVKQMRELADPPPGRPRLSLVRQDPREGPEPSR